MAYDIDKTKKQKMKVLLFQMHSFIWIRIYAILQ